MTYLRVLDEGNQIQDYCVQMDFVGAGVTVTRPVNNDYVVVTIPGAAAAGWVDDGAIVHLVTDADNVAIGSVDIIAGEKVRVVNVAGVAIRVEGREWFVKTGVADAAASQAPSYVERFTASMWGAGPAEFERDYDIYAAPSSLLLDETGGAYALLAVDYEGARCVEIFPDGLILPLTAAPGGGVDSNVLRFRGQTNVALRDFSILNEADNAADLYRLRFNRDDGMQMAALDSGGNLTIANGCISPNYSVSPTIAVIDNTGAFFVPTSGPAAGDDSVRLNFDATVVGPAARRMYFQMEGEAASDSYAMFLRDNGLNALAIFRNNAGAAEVGFLGAATVPRQTAATPTVAEIKAGLVALGLFNP